MGRGYAGHSSSQASGTPRPTARSANAARRPHATAAERARAVEIYLQTRSVFKASELTGRSPASIQRWVVAAGHTCDGGRVSDEEMQLTRRLYEAYGMQTDEIAHALDIDVSVVRERLRDLGVPKRPRWPRLDAARAEQAVALFHAGASYQAIAAQIGSDAACVRRTLADRGLKRWRGRGPRPA